MVSRAVEQENSFYSYYNEVQLAMTYSQLINTEPVLTALGEKLGYAVSSGQIQVEQIKDSLLMLVTVQDGNPQRAADIANSLVDVFIQYNETIQSGRYATSEQSLQAQIAQVEEQIAALQNEMSQISEQTLETQKQEVEARIQELQTQLDSSESEIITLESEIAALFPTLPTPTPLPPWRRPTPTVAPLPTPTLLPEDEIKYKELQNRLDQIKSLRDLYKNVYLNLLVMGEESSSGDPQLRQDQLQTTLALYQQIYSGLLSSYENVRLSRLRNTPNVVQIERAPVPGNPIKPNPERDALLGLVAGAFSMGALAFAIEYLDDTIKTPEDVARHLHLPVIGLIGEMNRSKGNGKEKKNGVYVAEYPLSPITEAFRTLRTNLDFAGVNKPLKTLLVTSAGPSEGKTTIAVNLSAAMAQGERKVVLIDSDLRRPSIHRYLGIANRKGLTDLFRDQIKLPGAITTWGEPRIAIITSGGLPPNPTELLGSEKMGAILDELKERSDIIILDAPPAIVADPIVLSAKVDAVLLIVEPGKTRIGAIQVLLEQLQRAGARVVGVVLNPITRRRAQYYSKYHYYSTYYYYSRSYGYYSSDNGGSRKLKKMKQAETTEKSTTSGQP